MEILKTVYEVSYQQQSIYLDQTPMFQNWKQDYPKVDFVQFYPNHKVNGEYVNLVLITVDRPFKLENNAIRKFWVCPLETVEVK